MPRLLICSLACIVISCAFGGASAASQELTLTLEAPALAPSSAPKPAAKPAARTADAVVKDDIVTVGRVGKICVSIAYIYKQKATNSGIFTSVESGTPMAVVRDVDSWYGVLMNNGDIGWVPKKNIEMIGYNLVADKDDLARGSYTSRGGEPMRATLLGASGGSEIIRTAMGYSGVRYVYGGTNPSTGMDCSAFVQSVFRSHGVRLPRTAREQALVGEPVPVDQLRPGDRLYFSCKYSYVDHCGIYAGNGYFIHSSVSRKGVGVDSLSSDYYWRSLVTARRS